jgi:hypothetical protein
MCKLNTSNTLHLTSKHTTPRKQQTHPFPSSDQEHFCTLAPQLGTPRSQMKGMICTQVRVQTVQVKVCWKRAYQVRQHFIVRRNLILKHQLRWFLLIWCYSNAYYLVLQATRLKWTISRHSTVTPPEIYNYVQHSKLFCCKREALLISEASWVISEASLPVPYAQGFKHRKQSCLNQHIFFWLSHTECMHQIGQNAPPLSIFRMCCASRKF